MIENFDSWLTETGPVALAVTEHLEPASGAGTPIFPPTFAGPEGSDEKPNYIVDPNGSCLIDSVGSQANRLEPIFKQKSFRGLVPSFTVKIGARTLDILNASHRAADAVVRYSDRQADLRAAFLAYRDQGEAEKLAKLAPTSLVFGAWDSRETYAKVPRLVESTIRAYDVQRLSRAAQFTPSITKQEIEDMDLASLGKLSEMGLDGAPSGATPGGVVARGGIRREALLNLIALRALAAPDQARSEALQRYILGLGLVVLAAPTQFHLRQGCILVDSENRPLECRLVWRDGHREPLTLKPADVLAYAESAAKKFGVGEPVTATFDPKLAKADTEAKREKKQKAKAAAKA